MGEPMEIGASWTLRNRMMRKIIVGTSMVLMILTLHAEAQKAWESEGINPELWMRLPFEDERPYIFTHGRQLQATSPGRD
jgi:hypothetical protein